jgi:hypothetical protein
MQWHSGMNFTKFVRIRAAQASRAPFAVCVAVIQLTVPVGECNVSSVEK